MFDVRARVIHPKDLAVERVTRFVRITVQHAGVAGTRRGDVVVTIPSTTTHHARVHVTQDGEFMPGHQTVTLPENCAHVLPYRLIRSEPHLLQSNTEYTPAML